MFVWNHKNLGRENSRLAQNRRRNRRRQRYLLPVEEQRDAPEALGLGREQGGVFPLDLGHSFAVPALIIVKSSGECAC